MWRKSLTVSPLLLWIAFFQVRFTVRAQETPAPATRKPATTQVAVAQPKPTTTTWRNHPSYQVFALHAALPAITAKDDRTLQVRGRSEFAFKLGQGLPEDNKEAFARECGVPIGVLSVFLKQLTRPHPVAPELAARELRTRIIDYRYLEDQWRQYRPPTELKKVKADALRALAVGNIEKAWEMFGALPRPQAPQALSILIQK